MALMERLDITDIADEYVVCRGIGHAWENNPSATVDSDLFRIATAVLTLRCTRCTTERFDYIGKDLRVWNRFYRYPPRYTTIRGQGNRPNLRGEMIRRSLLIRRYQESTNNKPNRTRKR
jgi:hypothetical protein